MFVDRHYGKTRCSFWNISYELMIWIVLFSSAVLFFAGNSTCAESIGAQQTKRTVSNRWGDENLNYTLIEFDINDAEKSGVAAGSKADGIAKLSTLAQAGRSGEPMLPYSLARVLLPANADPATVRARLEAVNWRDMPGEYEIAPAPPAATWDGEKYIFGWAGKDSSFIVAGRDTSIYGKDAYFPQEPVEIVSVGKLRRWKLVEVRIWRQAYNPILKKIRVLESGKAVISVVPLENVSDTDLSSVPSGTSYFLPELLSATVNPQDYDTFYSQQQALAGPTADYVIITTDTIRDNSTKLAALIVCKENCGHTVRVVTQASAADDTHYVSGSTADQRADNIRDWLQSHYLSDGIEYVLLIGDPHPTSFTSSTSVPMKMCYPRRGAGDGYEEAPSDMFFAELSNTWDYDGDGYYGEYDDDYRAGGADKHCEVEVGRIPFYGSYTDLDSILQKVIDYSSETGDRSWRDKVLIAAGVSNFSPQDENGDGFADVPFLSPSDRSFMDDWGQDIKLLASSEGFDAYTLYEKEGCYSDGSAYPLTACESPLTVNNFVSEWQNKYGFVTWSGHGSETTAYRFCWTSDSIYPNVCGNHYDHDETTWYTLFSTSQCSQLDNAHPSFVVPVSCTNAYPENTNNLAYRLLKHGAIGTFAGTRVTWYSVGPWSPSLGLSYADDASYGYYVFSRMSADDTAAAALNWCRSNFGTGWFDGSSWMNMVGINLYGAPGISMTTSCIPSSRPTAQNGSFSTRMNVPISIQLQATDDGLPNPPGALSYIITSLPGYGTLSDPEAGTIETVEYELLNNSNQVIYTPQYGYLGQDEFAFIADDGGEQPTGGDSNVATVSIGVVEYFTELFDSQDSDIDNRILTFAPDNSDCFYVLCRDATDEFPTDPNGGTVLPLNDDDCVQITLNEGKQVGVYGYTYGSFWVGGNGYITFDSDDTDNTETVADHLAIKRISALFDDLDPSAGGQVSWKQSADKAVVTFENVPEAGIANSNSFQIEMFFEGTIRLTYLNIDALDGLVGLSNGDGLSTDFVETDLSASVRCADFNGDDKVNIADFAILSLRWLDDNCTDSIWCGGTDLDRSNQVGPTDAANFARYWLVGDYPVEVEDTFTSIALHDGRVYDTDGDGIGDGTNSADATIEALRLGDWSANESYRSIVSFDTSSVPSDATILSAKLQLTCGKVEGTSPLAGWGGTCNIDIANPYFYTSDSLQDYDYHAVANSDAIASFTDNPSVGQTILSTDFNAQGLNNINIDGTTQMRIYFTTPTNNNATKDYLGFYSGEAADSEKQPKLTVCYTTLTPTLTFYSRASEDGRVYDDGSGVAGTGHDTGDSGSNSLRIGDYSGKQSYRTILSFDTSSIPADYTIKSARLKMTRGGQSGQNPFDWPGSCNIDIANPSFGDVALEDSDWETVGDAVAVAFFSEDPGAEDVMVSSDFNAAGLNNIDRNGITQLKVYFTTLHNNDSIADYLGFYSGEAVETNRPGLIIECSIN